MNENYEANVTNSYVISSLGYVLNLHSFLLNIAEEVGSGISDNFINIIASYYNSEGSRIIIRDIDFETLSKSLLNGFYREHISDRIAYFNGFIYFAYYGLTEIIGEDLIQQLLINTLKKHMPRQFNAVEVPNPIDIMLKFMESPKDIYENMAKMENEQSETYYQEFIGLMILPLEKMLYNIFRLIVQDIRPDWIKDDDNIDSVYL